MCHDFGLCQIIDRPTPGKEIIDKVFVSIPDILDKHQAIHVRSILSASETVIRYCQSIDLT